MSDGLPLASFKLRFFDTHVRALPACDAAGCPFSGPGVDLRGDDAREVLALAAPLVAWLEAREPVTVRTLSIDVARARVLVTLEDTPRPRVLRIDPTNDEGAARELVLLAAPVLRRLGALAKERIARRAR